MVILVIDIMCFMQPGDVCMLQRQRSVHYPFIPCDFALSHRRGGADCSVLSVLFNKSSTVASSLTQTCVWSDCQPARAHSLQHTPQPNSPVLSLHTRASSTLFLSLSL